MATSRASLRSANAPAGAFSLEVREANRVAITPGHVATYTLNIRTSTLADWAKKQLAHVEGGNTAFDAATLNCADLPEVLLPDGLEVSSAGLHAIRESIEQHAQLAVRDQNTRREAVKAVTRITSRHSCHRAFHRNRSSSSGGAGMARAASSSDGTAAGAASATTTSDSEIAGAATSDHYTLYFGASATSVFVVEITCSTRHHYVAYWSYASERSITQFRPMEVTLSASVEAAYQQYRAPDGGSSKAVFNVPMAFRTYQYNLENMTQTNLSHNTIRAIKRHPAVIPASEMQPSAAEQHTMHCWSTRGSSRTVPTRTTTTAPAATPAARSSLVASTTRGRTRTRGGMFNTRDAIVSDDGLSDSDDNGGAAPAAVTLPIQQVVRRRVTATQQQQQPQRTTAVSSSSSPTSSPAAAAVVVRSQKPALPRLFPLIKENDTKMLSVDLLNDDTIIGSGSSATVYACTFMGQPAAYKRFHKHITSDPAVVRELSTAPFLIHVNISRVLAKVESSNGERPAGLVMERLTPLSEIDMMSLSLSDRLRVAAEIASGLLFAHLCGLAHSDVKPENVMLRGDEGEIKKNLGKKNFVAVLGDFGAAHLMVTNQTMSGARGTPTFISPEYALGQPAYATPASDVFALAVTLWFLLHPPEMQEEIKRLGSNVVQIAMNYSSGVRPLISADESVVPSDVAALITSCWAQDPAQRPEMSDVVVRLNAAVKAQASREAEEEEKQRQKQQQQQQNQPSNTPTATATATTTTSLCPFNNDALYKGICGLDNIAAQLRSLTWRTNGRLFLSNDIVDHASPLWKFVMSQVRDTPDGAFEKTVSRIQMTEHLDSPSFTLIHESDAASRRANPFLRMPPQTDEDAVAGLDYLKSMFIEKNSGSGDEEALSHVLFCVHGTNANLVEVVARDGARALRIGDCGFFSGTSYVALEASYSAHYCRIGSTNANSEYAMILFAVSVSETYVVTLAADYRTADEEAKLPVEMRGFSKFYSGDKVHAVTMPPRADAMFIPVHRYSKVHPVSGEALPHDVGCQAISQRAPPASITGHELAVNSHLRMTPVAIIYFK